MLKYLLFTFFALTILSPLMLPQPAFAQLGNDKDDNFVNQYDPKYRPSFDGEDTEEDIYDSTNLLPNFIHKIDFVRLPGALPGDITLRITSPGAVSGCLDIVQPTIKAKKMGTSIKLELTESRLNVDKSNVEYGINRCKPKIASSKVDYTLTREELIAKQIKKIQIRSKKTGPIADLKVETDEEKIRITAKPADLRRMGQPYKNGKNKTIFWFYPENTIVLYNATLNLNDSNILKIAALAKSKGLIPLTDILPEFRTTKSNRDKLYFVDQTGAYAAQIKEAGGVATLGNIELNETYHGPQGAYEKPVSKPILAKRPGAYE